MENQNLPVELTIPFDRLDSELIGIEVELIEAIRSHCEVNNISIRKLATITGLSSGKLKYHLQGGGDSTLYNLLIIAQKIGLSGSITLNLKPKADL
jgi:hypothetical protein